MLAVGSASTPAPTRPALTGAASQGVIGAAPVAPRAGSESGFIPEDLARTSRPAKPSQLGVGEGT